MKILVVCQHFYPENFRINDICYELVEKGNDVTVLTGLPNYPKGKVLKEYKWFKKHGSGRPGYSNGVKVTVHKNGHKYKGTAYAVKNSKGIRCEVRGVGNGLYISNWGDYRL